MSNESASVDWVESLIDGMEADFDPTSKFPISDLEDGGYTFEILDMGLEKLESTGDPIVKWKLRVEDGPAAVGALVEKTSFLNSPVGVNVLGAELTTLGSLPKDWKKNGPLGKQVIAAISASVGKKFRAKKKANVSSKNGKTYHNLSILSLVSTGESDTPF